ncbi:MAG: ATP-binding protein [Planctomycetota bacterium]|nr:ATP-binding protein [Planctomycetota bacterium]
MTEPAREKIVVTNDTKFLSVVRDFVANQTQTNNIAPDSANKIILAVDEAVANIIEHAYEEQITGTIEIETEISETRFKISIRDSGKKFRPDSVETPNMTEHVKSGKKKGLGIFLMRQIMDEVRYVFKEGIQNELVLVKYLRTG